MISIIIPAYNGAEFLDSALASIEAQQFADQEVLLVDDGSPVELTPPAFVRYFRQPHLGASAAYNHGIRESRGEFVAFLDIDDMWTPGHLSRLHAALLAHPEAGVAQGRMRQLCGDRISGAYRMPYIQSCMFRREVFEVNGGFDETLSLGEDHDLMYRCWEKDIVKINVHEVSFIYRRHPGNISRGKNLRSHVMVLQRRIERIQSGLVDPNQKRRFDFREYIGETEGASQWDSLVSVVIPAHNSQRYIVPTLESLLVQRHRPLEILVVDDGSTDSTAQIVRGFAPDVRLIEQDQRGHPAARNTGIRAAAGEFLGFLDHDDLWSPDKLERQLASFERNPALDLVFGHIQNFFTPEMPPEECERFAVPLQPLPGLLQGAMLARRRSFDGVGLFSEKRSIGDFLDWYGRAMLARMNVEMLPETVVYRRIHANNYQRTHQHQRREYLGAVKDLLDRRRGIMG